jgi:DNA invertase Pin-like site-specific DNA recombinase
MYQARRKTVVQPTPGWATYLRVSDEEAQNPEASKERQRFFIQRGILDASPLAHIEEYSDLLTGRNPHRKDYQRMLHDARLGKFSFVAVERADRFGRNDTEALRAIDELSELGVAIRFANQPDLDPMDPDDRIIVTLSFTLARRESMLLGARVRNAAQTKRQSGGFVGGIPDGYISVEDEQPNRKTYAKKTHHIELDPDRAPIWRLAWNLLLEDKMTLAEICEELNRQGYRHRSGRPFVEIKPNGIRKANYSTLARVFRNWTYAGWVTSENENILPKTLRGTWEPLISTEELEEGIRILDKRTKSRMIKGRHHYLLAGLIFIQIEPATENESERLLALTCSKSNIGRPSGGNPHYRLPRYSIHFPCDDVDSQLEAWLYSLQVDKQQLERIRNQFSHDINHYLSPFRTDRRSEIEQGIKKINDEEARVLRLAAQGLVSESNWRGLWLEWQDRKMKLASERDLLERSSEVYVSDLDQALMIISKVGILYKRLSTSEKKELVRNLVKRVVVDYVGRIIRVELLPPFAYIKSLNGASSENGGKISLANRKGELEAACSNLIPSCDSDRTRTYNRLIKSQLLCQLSYGAITSAL